MAKNIINLVCKTTIQIQMKVQHYYNADTIMTTRVVYPSPLEFIKSPKFMISVLLLKQSDTMEQFIGSLACCGSSIAN